MLYGILLNTFKIAAGNAICLIQGFQFVSMNDEILLNNFECPMLQLSKTIFTTPGSNVKRAVSIVHECTDSCSMQEVATIQSIERENISCNKLEFNHDYTNSGGSTIALGGGGGRPPPPPTPPIDIKCRPYY